MYFSEIADYAQDLKNACLTGNDFNGQRFRTVSFLRKNFGEISC
jgi:hypothetical protein